MEKLTLPHRLPTLAALAPTPSPLLQQRFMKKETPPQPDRARIAPSSQELRHRNSPVKSPGGSTRECEKQQQANTKLPLRTWFLAMYLMTQTKNGISALELSRQLSVSSGAIHACTISRRLSRIAHRVAKT